jgi:hypothetical protein
MCICVCIYIYIWFVCVCVCLCVSMQFNIGIESFRMDFSSSFLTKIYMQPTCISYVIHVSLSYLIDNTGQQISNNFFVSVMNMLLIYLFASMKLENGHKKIIWL